MEFLARFLGMEAPENTVLQSAEVGFRGAVPWWLAGAVVLALAAAVFFLYTRERGKLGLFRRLILAGLRTALLVLILLLLFRPVLLAEFSGARPRGVAFLIDNSQSLTLQDRRLTEADRLRVAIAEGLVPLTTPINEGASVAQVPANTPKDPSRADLVRAVMKHRDLKLLDNLRRHGPLRVYLFGQSLRGVGKEGGKTEKTSLQDEVLATFTAAETKTALHNAIYEVLQRKDGDVPAALVVFTDGQDNESKYTLREAAQEAARWGVPLHIYGLGTAEGGSLQLKGVDIPETIFFDDTVRVPIRWRAHGFKKGDVEIKLTLGGREMAKKELPVELGEDLREDLYITPEKERDREKELELVATIRLKGNDTFKDTFKKQVRVLDSRIRVLYVESSPRFEFKFLQPALGRDRRLKVDIVLTNADPKVLSGGPPFLPGFPPTREKFFDAKYDLLILGDVPAGYFGKEHLEWIREFVQNRGGLIAMAGRQHMPASYENTPLAEVLPIEFKAVKFPVEADVRSQEYLPSLTEAGKRTDMLALADAPDENLKIWQSLPGFFWQYPVVKLRPGAVALVVNPRAKMGQTEKQPMPVMASQYYGKGRVLFLGTDETWRWRYNTQDKRFVRFWGQVIYQMGLPHLMGDHSKRVQMALEGSKAVYRKQGQIYVRLLDKDFRPRKDAQVDAVLDFLGPGPARSRKIKLDAIPGREGEYRQTLAHDQPGRYEIKLNNPEPVTFSFRVDPQPDDELLDTGMAEAKLREAAALSGGRFYREEDLHSLAESIPTRTVAFTRHQEMILWNPLAFVVFLLLISAEWLVRKFSDLS
jgi:hypothetical protein